MEDCEAVYTNRIIRDWWVAKTEDERRLMVRSYFSGGNSEKIHTLYGIMPEEMEEIYNINSTITLKDPRIQDLENFLNHIHDNCTDKWGSLLVCKTGDHLDPTIENVVRDYVIQNPIL
jgi:hypothetical protein